MVGSQKMLEKEKYIYINENHFSQRKTRQNKVKNKNYEKI